MESKASGKLHNLQWDLSMSPVQTSLPRDLGAEVSAGFSCVDGGHHSVSSGMASSQGLALAQHASRALHLHNGAALSNLPAHQSALSYCCGSNVR